MISPRKKRDREKALASQLSMHIIAMSIPVRGGLCQLQIFQIMSDKINAPRPVSI